MSLSTYSSLALHSTSDEAAQFTCASASQASQALDAMAYFRKDEERDRDLLSRIQICPGVGLGCYGILQEVRRENEL